MKLYHVLCEDYELFVWAHTPGQAVEYWRAYYEMTGDVPEAIYQIPLDDTTEGAVPWHGSPRAPVLCWQR